MNIETVREYCLSLPYATEDMAFGEEYLLMRVCGRIFACAGLENPDYFVVKCAPDYAIELRERYRGIVPAWHWNKKYWNQLTLSGELTDQLLMSLIRHSYSEVVKKLPRKMAAQYPGIHDVEG